MLTKILKTYIPYKDGKWDFIILNQMKDETGFDPPIFEDEVSFDLDFLRIFLNEIPEGKNVSVNTINSESKNLHQIVVEISWLQEE